MFERHSSPRSGLALFALGTLIGAGVALLFAPQSGEKTRKLLAKKAKQIRDRAQDTVENAQEVIKDRKKDFAAAIGSGRVGHSKNKRS
jgi:gas vesicle protein